MSDRAVRAQRAVARWCGTATHAHELFRGLSERLRPVLGQEASAWLVTDPETVLFTDAYVEGWPVDACKPFFHNEMAIADVDKFSALAASPITARSLRHATAGQPHTSHRWREVLRPSNLDDELRVVFRDPMGCWGAGTLTRSIGVPSFGPEEEELLASVTPVVTAALRRLVLSAPPDTPSTEGPGLLLIDPEGEITPATAQGAHWLAQLGINPGGRGHASLLALRELIAGGRQMPRELSLRSRDGRWLQLHADHVLHGTGQLAVIVDTAHPVGIGAIVARAYGLTDREREVVAAVARGQSTGDIAAELHVSPHTVRDHLKSAFAKTGVGSRAELVARLFHDHYADRLFTTAHVTD